MCGIVGYLGKNDCVENIKEGLLSVEYRGYDSAGISYIHDGAIQIQKRVGSVANLFDSITCPTDTHCGIGHTRWATHGEVCEKNAHPHISFDNRFSLVHNGIIENYAVIKDGILKDIPFRTNVDTESIVNLVAYFRIVNPKLSVLEALCETLKNLQGSYAVAMLALDTPDTIYFARKESPLLIGKGDGETFISSDVLGLGKSCSEYVVVPNGVYGYINKDEVKAFEESGSEVCLEFKSMISHSERAQKGDNAHFMQKEINEIPTVIENTVKIYLNEDNPISKVDKSFWQDIEKIEFIACGTSYHASMVGAMFTEDNAHKVARTHLASEFVYNPPLLNKNTLCVFVSQSGETADTLHAVRVAKERGAKSLGITNVMTSNLASECDVCLPICAGVEVAVASTKAYNAQVTVMMILADFLRDGDYKDIAEKILSQAASIDLDGMWASAKKFVKRVANSRSIYFVGRHMDYITCLESCLKLKEISYIPCEAYAAGELKHGTIALVEDGTTMLAIVTEPKLISKTLNIVEQAKARGAKLIYFTSLNLKDFAVSEKDVMAAPKVDVELSPLFSIIPMQMLSYMVSVYKGYNPDRPRNLAKSVTVE